MILYYLFGASVIAQNVGFIRIAKPITGRPKMDLGRLVVLNH